MTVAVGLNVSRVSWHVALRFLRYSWALTASVPPSTAANLECTAYFEPARSSPVYSPQVVVFESLPELAERVSPLDDSFISTEANGIERPDGGGIDGSFSMASLTTVSVCADDVSESDPAKASVVEIGPTDIWASGGGGAIASVIAQPIAVLLRSEHVDEQGLYMKQC